MSVLRIRCPRDEGARLVNLHPLLVDVEAIQLCDMAIYGGVPSLDRLLAEVTGAPITPRPDDPNARQLSGELGDATVSQLIEQIGGTRADPSTEVVALADRMASWMAPRARAELTSYVPFLVDSGAAGPDGEERMCLAALDWFVRRFAPALLHDIHEPDHALLVLSLEPVQSVTELDGAANLCGGMTHILSGGVENVFRIGADAVRALELRAGIQGRNRRRSRRYQPGQFGRLLGDALVTAALTVYGGSVDIRNLRGPGDWPDGFDGIDWRGLLDAMLDAR